MTLVLILFSVFLGNSKVSESIVDPAGDVSITAIDIVTVSKESSKITVTTSSSLFGISPNTLGTLFVLCDSDYDDNLFEGGIVYSFMSSGANAIHWTINGVDKNTNWNTQTGTNFVLISGSTISFTFSEFPAIIVSSCIAISVNYNLGNSNYLIDWAPDYQADKLTADEVLKLRPITYLDSSSKGTTGTSTISTQTTSSQPSTTTTISTNTTQTGTATTQTSSIVSITNTTTTPQSSNTGQVTTTSKISNTTIPSDTGTKDNTSKDNISTANFMNVGFITMLFVSVGIKRRNKLN